MNPRRITCLLGAGAVIEIGGPTTQQITDDVRDAWTSNNVPNCITNNLTGNFEQQFHLLETLSSFSQGTYNPATEILQPKCVFRNVEWRELKLACNILLGTIGRRINEYNCSWGTASQNDWFRKFWRKLASNAKLDIITLNYDTCIEQCLSAFDDGFSERICVEDLNSRYGYRFHPEKLQNSKKNKVMHLHGCINYGMGGLLGCNKYEFNDSFYDLYKYNSYEEASRHWFGHSNPSTQAGEELYTGAIITGLRKTEKILDNPYMSYHYEFQYALRHNKSLLIIGYSNSDEYINAELMRMKQYHGNKCRIVVISYMPDNVRTNWNSDPHRRKWPEENTYYMLSHIMGSAVARILASNKIPDKDVIDSEDGCVKWYLCGFQTAIKRYKKDIIKFLTSISVF